MASNQQTESEKTSVPSIPKEWEVGEIETCLEKLIDYRGKTPKKASSGIETLSAKSIKNGRVDYSQVYFISEKTFAEWEKRGTPKLGDVLLTTEGPLGEVAQIDKERVALAQRLIVLRGKKNELDNTYLKYFLMSPFGQHELFARATGTTVQGIKQSEFRKVRVIKPPFQEQRLIARVLSRLDSKIELNQKMSSNMEAVGQIVFKRWFVDFEFPNQEGKPYKSSGGKMIRSPLGDIPENWQIEKVEEVLELAYGKALKETTRSSGEIPVFGSNGQIGWHNERLVQGPGIVVGRKGNPGTVTWVNTDFFPIDTTFYVVPKKPVESLPCLFYTLALQNLSSLSADSAVPGLNRNIVYMNDMLVPERMILRRFDSIIKGLFSRIQHNDKQTGTLIQLRQLLLPRLMSGKIRVPIQREGVTNDV